MIATVAGIHVGIDTHANRPAGNAVPDGSLYSCSTHSLVYKSNFAGNSWATWATLGAALATGHEFDYVEFTAPVSPTATTEDTADTVVTGSSVAYDGSTVVMIEFYALYSRPDNTAASRQLRFHLYEDGSSIGRIGLQVGPAALGDSKPIWLRRRMTPTNASHTYSIRASVDAGTGLIGAGAGGHAADMPGYIRITRV